MEHVAFVRTTALSVVFVVVIPVVPTTVFNPRIIRGLAAFGHGTPIPC